jgi:hypothetical protein
MGGSMSIVLQSTSGGSVTINEPTTASNFTLSLPAATGTSVIQNGSNNLLMNSGYGSDAVAYGCRAWVNFNGTGTVAIRASGNVSSITDNGTGDYTVNFTTAMPDINYSALFGAWGNALSSAFAAFEYSATTRTVNSIRFATVYSDPGVAYDGTYVSAAIFR